MLQAVRVVGLCGKISGCSGHGQLTGFTIYQIAVKELLPIILSCAIIDIHYKDILELCDNSAVVQSAQHTNVLSHVKAYLNLQEVERGLCRKECKT